MEKVELCFFALSHLVCIVMLTFHSVLELFVVWPISDVRSCDPVL